jgi:hypothetical protein
LGIVLVTYEKLIVNIILSGKKVKAFPLKFGMKQGCSLSPPLINIVLEILARAFRQVKEMKWICIEKKEIKLSLVADDKTLHLEDATDSTRRLLDQINIFSNVAGCKINIQILIVLLYTNSQLSKKEFRKQSHLQ